MPEATKVSRRDVLKTAGAVSVASAATLAAPHIRKVKAAGNQVSYGVIGTGSRGTYLLQHLQNVDSGRCVAVCDIFEPNLKKGIDAAGNTEHQIMRPVLPASWTD